MHYNAFSYLIRNQYDTRHSAHKSCIQIEKFFSAFLLRAIIFACATAIAIDTIYIIVFLSIVCLIGFSFLRC